MKRGFLRTLLVCVLVLCMLGNTALTAFAAPAGGTKKGDANGDGMVLANDAMLVLQYSVKAIPADRVNLAVCDMDGNGMILANDAMIILQYSVGMGPAEPEEPYVPEPEEKQYLPNRSEDFTFLVGCQRGEDYLRENLVLQGENGAVAYSVTEEEEGIYRIAATKPYQQYQTYYAWVAEDMQLPEYEDYLGLEFNIVGPDYANVEFNEDNLIFLKPLELQEYGTYGQYDLQWDEEAQRYYLTLFRLENVQDSMIGKVIGIGDYSNTDEILEDGSRELYFGKLDKIGRNPEGQSVLELTIPELSEVYDKLDIYFTGGTGDIQIEGDPEAAFTDAVVNSEGFAEYIAATHLAAESYAAEHGLVTETMTASVKDNLKFELTKHSLDPIEGRNACKLELGGKISYKVPLKTKDGQLSGSIVMSCYADITSEISAGGHFKDKKSTELYLTNITTTTLGFETKFDLEYNQKSETTYLVHNATHKIHTATCRIATKETNSANQQKLTAQELSELYNGDKEAMQRDECKVCKAVTGLDGTAYAYNRNTGVLHCMNCIHVGSIKECNLYTLYPANTFGFDTCEDCRPQDRQNKDFDKRMENAIQGSDWGETVTELREMLGDSLGAQKPGPDSDPALSANFNVLGVFNIRLGVEPVVEFDMKASVKFEITATTTNEYGIRSKGKGFETFHEETTEKPKIDLEFTGEADAKFGIELSAKAYPTGFGEGIYIEIKGQVGLYGHLTGILSVEGQLGGDIDAYCAARLEAGLYLRLDGSWKILWFDDDFVILEETRKALLKWGYDRMYYAFEEEEIEVTVEPDEFVFLNLPLLMKAKYLDMTNLQPKSDTISPVSKSLVQVAVDIRNEDGTPCNYLEYVEANGMIHKKNNAPEEFTAVVTVQVAPKVLIDSVGDFLASGTTDVETPVYGYSMDPLVVRIHVEKKDEPKLLKQVKLYRGDNVNVMYTFHYNQDRQLVGADYTHDYGEYTDHFTYTYDEDGRLLLADRDCSWLYFDHDEYVYNDVGLLACHKSYWATTRIPDSQYNYEYDEQGHLTKKIYLLPNDDGTAMEVSRVYESPYIYDAQGRVVEEQYPYTDSVSVYRYLYDEQGRVLTEHYAHMPADLCNPEGNPDWEWSDTTHYYYDYAPIVIEEGDELTLHIQDSVGVNIWSQYLGTADCGVMEVDDEGYLVGITGLCAGEFGDRCELIYDGDGGDIATPDTEEQVTTQLSSVVTYADGKESEEYVLTYNDQGQIVGLEAFRYEGKSAKDWYTQEYAYDTHGNLIEIEHLTAQGYLQQYFYQYDYRSDGRIAMYSCSECYQGEWGPVEWYFLSYDDQGRVIERSTTENTSVEKFSYDESGNTIYASRDMYWGDGHFVEATEYDYTLAPFVVAARISKSEEYGDETSMSISLQPHWNLNIAAATIDESCSIEKDSAGRLVRVVDVNGDNVYVCKYKKVSSAGADSREKYEEFLDDGGFYSDWDDLDISTYYTDMYYGFVDIDQNGVEELIVTTDNRIGYLAFLVYAVDEYSGEITRLPVTRPNSSKSVRFSYGYPRYSPERKALVFADPKYTSAAGKTEFFVIDGDHLVSIGEVGNAYSDQLTVAFFELN